MELGPEAGRVVPMRVIVCGVHRTGTLSMRHALWRLGIFDCYHMQSNVANGAVDGPYWVRAFHAKYSPDKAAAAPTTALSRTEWDELLGRCQAVCDLPAALFGAELAEAYPEAKVVILHRDPERWYESVLGAMYKQFQRQMTLWGKIRMVYRLALDPVSRGTMAANRAMVELAMPHDHGRERERALRWYEDQYREFRERIPEGRRVELRVQDGWAPLCAFLGVDVPRRWDEAAGAWVEEAFPHVNDREAFAVEYGEMGARGMQRAHENLLKLVGRAAVMGAVGYGVYLSWRTRLGGRF